MEGGWPIVAVAQNQNNYTMSTFPKKLTGSSDFLGLERVNMMIRMLIVLANLGAAEERACEFF